MRVLSTSSASHAVPSLALFCERRWLARWSLFSFCDQGDSRMRAALASSAVVERHELFRERSSSVARGHIDGTPPPLGEDALRRSLVASRSAA